MLEQPRRRVAARGPPAGHRRRHGVVDGRRRSARCTPRTAVRQYIVDLTHATRSSTALRLGASPRATLHLLRASRAHAALAGRDHVLPDDVQQVAVPVLAHRLIPTGETQMARRTTADVVGDLLQRVRVPGPHPLSARAPAQALPHHARRGVRRRGPGAGRVPASCWASTT